MLALSITVTTSAILWLLALGVVVAIAGWLAGVFRARSILGPQRLGDDMPLWPVLLITCLAGAAWFGSQIVYGMIQAVLFMRSHPGEHLTLAELTSRDFAILSTVPAAFGFFILLIADARLGLIRRLGFHPDRLFAGIWRGLLGALMVLPMMFVAALALEAIYRAVGYQHPTEHDLLRAMKTAGHLTRATLILGACVAAPVFEEYLFRGHIQTFLGRLFLPRLLAVDQAPPGEPPLPSVLEYTSPFPPPRRERSVMSSWLAVIVTSILFAVVHPLWMAPLIFVLAICLGYAYERTGNLWVSIVIHAMFNIVSTVEFLNLVQ